VAGRMLFDFRTQPLQPLLEEALASNRGYADKYGVDYVLVGASTHWVHVDGMRLQQVLANLLSNAAKFSPDGSAVEVTVSDQAGRVRVSVHDHGPGIPEEFKARIFQKFSQADASDSRHKGGTGLGLAITKELVERMGGTVGFASQAGAGSTFWFELPCVEPDAAGKALPQA
jgi:signal transduction histidine kinase